MSNIGMMDGAFFVGRKEIVDWINATLDLNLTKVEQTCNGAIAVQLLDIMYPGKIPMSKLNWAAKQDHEYVNNYKVLQNCFTKLKIDRHVDVDRLVKGKYQDNLEFMQWFKRFFEMTVSDQQQQYDAEAQRAKGKGGAAYNLSTGAKSGMSSVAKVTAGASAATRSSKSSTSSTSSTTAKKTTTSRAPALSKKPAPTAASSALQEELDALNATHAELQVEMSGIEKERDFYFDKLRDIEMMLQDLEDAGKGNELTTSIFKILYATADGFEPADQLENEGHQEAQSDERQDESQHNNTVEPEEEAQDETY